MSNSDKFSPILWLWIPVGAIIAQIITEIILPSPVLASLLSEGGPHEAIEFILLALAFLVAMLTLCRMDIKQNPWLAAWVGLAALCCFYVAGEEISWGQHILHWSTPEYWAALNDQNETNLHNTSSWLDQKPRLLLFIGIMVGGLIIPFLKRYKAQWLPQRFAIIYPPSILSVTAAFVAVVHILDALNDSFFSNIKFFERSSEIEELYIFYFVLIYLIVLRRRIMQDKR